MLSGRDGLKRNEPLSRHTSLRIGGPAAFWYESTVSELQMILELAVRAGLPVLVLGDGTNVLVSDAGYDGMVIRISDTPISSFHPAEGGVDAYAGASGEWDELVQTCVRQNLQGIECLAGIPGTVGAAPVQNIGAYGQQISDVVLLVEAFDRIAGIPVLLNVSECQFGYRSSIFNRPETAERYIITAVKFRLHRRRVPCRTHSQVREITEPRDGLVDVYQAVLRIRNRKGMLLNRPSNRSAGSFFKNPIVPVPRADALLARFPSDVRHERFWPTTEGIKISAAFLIEQAGFAKGYRRGHAAISPAHTLALVNWGGATAAEIVALAREIQEQVSLKFNVLLEPEVQLIGFSEYPLLK